MIVRMAMAAVAVAGLFGAAPAARAAGQSFEVICPIEVSDGSGECGGGDGGGTGGGGVSPTYVLQGVIQNQGYETGPGGGKRVKIRGYSRLANMSNDRVDADFISVRCNAYDNLGGYTTDYDEESNGALVDVHFASNFVYGMSTYRRITVVCVHNATKGVNTYSSTSTAEIDIP